MAVLDVLSASNELFCIYITWSCILMIKMLAMSVVTVYYRFKNKVRPFWCVLKIYLKYFQNIQASMNPEDVFFNKNFEVKQDDEVDRVRRSHLNDLENILTFILLGLCFIFTEPNLVFASWLFRIAGISRIAHSFIYVCKVRQPFRAMAYYITYVICLYMALSSIVYFFSL